MSHHIVEVISRKIAANEWHNSFSRCRRHTYAGESFDGTWELKLAMLFDSIGMHWQRNKQSFPYTYQGKERHYTPDFYMPDADCYVEVKGWKTPKDEMKWEHFPHTLIVLSGGDLVTMGIDINIRTDWRWFFGS